MKITIDSSILQRLSRLEHVKIDINSGKSYIIGTDGVFACIYYIGETDQADDSCFLKLDIDKVENEANFGGSFTFDTLPELPMSSVVTSSGQDCSEFVIWPDESPLNKWRDWFKLSTTSKGSMYIDIKELIALWETSPTGCITFPEVINAVEPLIVRDVNNADWLGVFIPTVDGKAVIKPATLPEWL